MLLQGFGAFERSILTQIDHIMMDKERLLRRTQTKRSVYTVLGKQEQQSQPVPESLPENSVRVFCLYNSSYISSETQQSDSLEPLAGDALVCERFMRRYLSVDSCNAMAKKKR